MFSSLLIFPINNSVSYLLTSTVFYSFYPKQRLRIQPRRKLHSIQSCLEPYFHAITLIGCTFYGYRNFEEEISVPIPFFNSNSWVSCNIVYFSGVDFKPRCGHRGQINILCMCWPCIWWQICTILYHLLTPYYSLI